jgi:hypothetical protein
MPLHFGHHRSGVAALGLELADLLAQRVAARLQFFGASLDSLALGLERGEVLASREGWGVLRVSRRAITPPRGRGAAG